MGEEEEITSDELIEVLIGTDSMQQKLLDANEVKKKYKIAKSVIARTKSERDKLIIDVEVARAELEMLKSTCVPLSVKEELDRKVSELSESYSNLVNTSEIRYQSLSLELKLSEEKHRKELHNMRTQYEKLQPKKCKSDEKIKLCLEEERQKNAALEKKLACLEERCRRIAQSQEQCVRECDNKVRTEVEKSRKVEASMAELKHKIDLLSVQLQSVTRERDDLMDRLNTNSLPQIGSDDLTFGREPNVQPQSVTRERDSVIDKLNPTLLPLIENDDLDYLTFGREPTAAPKSLTPKQTNLVIPEVILTTVENIDLPLLQETPAEDSDNSDEVTRILAEMRFSTTMVSPLSISPCKSVTSVSPCKLPSASPCKSAAAPPCKLPPTLPCKLAPASPCKLVSVSPCNPVDVQMAKKRKLKKRMKLTITWRKRMILSHRKLASQFKQLQKIVTVGNIARSVKSRLLRDKRISVQNMKETEASTQASEPKQPEATSQKKRTLVKQLHQWRVDNYLSYPSAESDLEAPSQARKKRLKRQKGRRLRDTSEEEFTDTIYTKSQGSVDSGYFKGSDSESDVPLDKLASIYKKHKRAVSPKKKLKGEDPSEDSVKVKKCAVSPTTAAQEKPKDPLEDSPKDPLEDSVKVKKAEQLVVINVPVAKMQNVETQRMCGGSSPWKAVKVNQCAVSPKTTAGVNPKDPLEDLVKVKVEKKGVKAVNSREEKVEEKQQAERPVVINVSVAKVQNVETQRRCGGSSPWKAVKVNHCAVSPKTTAGKKPKDPLEVKVEKKGVIAVNSREEKVEKAKRPVVINAPVAKVQRCGSPHLCTLESSSPWKANTGKLTIHSVHVIKPPQEQNLSGVNSLDTAKVPDCFETPEVKVQSLIKAVDMQNNSSHIVEVQKVLSKKDESFSEDFMGFNGHSLFPTSKSELLFKMSEEDKKLLDDIIITLERGPVKVKNKTNSTEEKISTFLNPSPLEIHSSSSDVHSSTSTTVTVDKKITTTEQKNQCTNSEAGTKICAPVAKTNSILKCEEKIANRKKQLSECTTPRISPRTKLRKLSEDLPLPDSADKATRSDLPKVTELLISPKKLSPKEKFRIAKQLALSPTSTAKAERKSFKRPNARKPLQISNLESKPLPAESTFDISNNSELSSVTATEKIPTALSSKIAEKVSFESIGKYNLASEPPQTDTETFNTSNPKSVSVWRNLEFRMPASTQESSVLLAKRINTILDNVQGVAIEEDLTDGDSAGEENERFEGSSGEEDEQFQSPASPEPDFEGMLVEPTLIPLCASSKAVPEKLDEVILKKLLHFPKQKDVAACVLEHFANKPPELTAKLILKIVSQDVYSPAEVFNHRRAPYLSVTQQLMLGLLLSLEERDGGAVTTVFMRLAEQRILALQDAECIVPVARVHAAVCKLKFDYCRMRVFICKAFARMGDLALHYFYVVLTSWLELLPHQTAVSGQGAVEVRTLVQLARLRKSKIHHNLMLLLVTYGFSHDCDNSAELLEELCCYYLSAKRRDSLFCLIVALCQTINEKIVIQQLQTLKADFELLTNERHKCDTIKLIGCIRALHKSSNLSEIEQWIEQFTNDVHEDVRSSSKYVLDLLAPLRLVNK